VRLDHAEFVECRVDDAVEALEIRLCDLDLGEVVVVTTNSSAPP
jgi:hypothetical protein